MAQDCILLLFLKAPIRGRVKTRLAADIGRDHALNLYKSFVLDTLDMIKRTGYPARICFYPEKAGPEVADWLGNDHEYMPQNGNDIGERMEQAFSRVFSEGFTRAVIIGSDIPDLKQKLIHNAFTFLEKTDVVVGPAVDGGYYLIGFNKASFLSRPFRGIAWGTPSVFEDTLRSLQAAARQVHVLDAWPDVDCLADLESLLERSGRSRSDGSRTIEYIRANARDFFNHRQTPVSARKRLSPET